jgi:exopolysaccharide biosynthesis polyprenyl glycosylphosphotransferase
LGQPQRASDSLTLVRSRQQSPAPPPPATERLAPFGLTTTRVVTLIDLIAVVAASVTSPQPVNAAHVSFAISIIGLNVASGLNRSRLTLSILDDSAALAGHALAAYAVATTVGVLTGPSAYIAHIRPLFVYFAVAAGLRAGAFALIRHARRRRWIAHPTIVVGTGDLGATVARLLQQHPECGLQPVGFVDASPRLIEQDQPLPVLGSEPDLAQIIVRHEIKHAIVAFPSTREAEMVDVIRTCDRLDCEIWTVPRMFELSQAKSRDIDTLWGIPLIRLQRSVGRSFSWRIKRLLDIVVSALVLVLISPLLLALALAVWAEVGRPILFRQTRTGIDHRGFTLLKFRTLASRDSEEAAILWSVANDARVGRVGRLLRRTSLDELPQFWNVLRGDMSLVGPRPERPHFVAEFGERYGGGYRARHRVPSGLTGWAQVHGLRGNTSISERARFDNYYIDNWSLWFDLRILMRTVLAVLRREGA